MDLTRHIPCILSLFNKEKYVSIVLTKDVKVNI